MADPIEQRLRFAHRSFAQGRLAESRLECQALLAQAPRDPGVLHLAAIVELQSGNRGGALELIDRAVRANPADAAQHQTRGQILRASGRAAQALEAFRLAVKLAPAFPEGHASLGHALLEGGEPRLAREHLSQALKLRPRAAEWHYNLALAHSLLGAPEEALASLQSALELRPAFALASNLLGTLLRGRGDARGAMEAFSAALRADPALADAHNNLGVALLALQRAPESEASFRSAIAIRPGHCHAWNNLGNALRQQGRVEEAEAAFLRATQCDPPLDAAWVNRGNILRELDRPEEALACFRQALDMRPDSPEANLSAAITRLLVGDLETAWDQYRWRQGGAPDAAIGEALERSLAEGRPIELVGEQGLGDVLFFLRWAPQLRQAGARLLFRGDPRLFPLLRPGGLFDGFAATDHASSRGALRVPVGDLPWLAGSRSGVRYPAPFALAAAEATIEAMRDRLSQAGPAPYIGLAWRAGAQAKLGEEHLSKKVPLDEMGAALRAIPATFISLQREPEPGETARLSTIVGREVVDRAGVNADLGETLALLGALDEYVGVSSTNAHMLAGLGKSARILVASPPEWRYGRSGKSSAWFPAFHLYREEREGGWSQALRDLHRDLGQEDGSR